MIAFQDQSCFYMMYRGIDVLVHRVMWCVRYAAFTPLGLKKILKVLNGSLPIMLPHGCEMIQVDVVASCDWCCELALIK